VTHSNPSPNHFTEAPPPVPQGLPEVDILELRAAVSDLIGLLKDKSVGFQPPWAEIDPQGRRSFEAVLGLQDREKRKSLKTEHLVDQGKAESLAPG
jgi:hypothetical protein